MSNIIRVGNSYSPKPIDKEKLNKAFRLLRKEGLIARQKFSCCNSCASGEIATEIEAWPHERQDELAGVVFYCKQGDPSSGRLYLRYGPVTVQRDGKEHVVGKKPVAVGKLLVNALKTVGLAVEWNGKANECVLVKGD